MKVLFFVRFQSAKIAAWKKGIDVEPKTELAKTRGYSDEFCNKRTNKQRLVK